MRTVFLLAALLAPSASTVSAAPGPSRPATAAFEARIAAAQAAIATREGFAYDTALVPAIHHALLPCVPPGADPARGGGFTLVADVDANGRLHAVDVRPATPIARCFARSFGATRLRPPPAAPRPRPVVVRMSTHR